MLYFSSALSADVIQTKNEVDLLNVLAFRVEIVDDVSVVSGTVANDRSVVDRRGWVLCSQESGEGFLLQYPGAESD